MTSDPHQSHESDLSDALLPSYTPRNAVLSLDDIMALPSAEWLVKGVIPANGVGVIYGRPSAGKTFFSLSVGLSIAHGLSCFGRNTLQGNMAIVAAEGASGLRNRVQGWHDHHGLDWRGFPAVQVVPNPVNLLDSTSARALIQDLHHAFRGDSPRLVIVDTLARCFGDGDENRQPDMARFVEGCELIQRKFDCAVCVVHHTPKDGDELRGSGALEGAAEFVIRINKTETAVKEAFIRKMKDGKDNFTLGFHLKEMVLGTDSDGEPITTEVAVLEGDIRAGGTLTGNVAPTGKNQNAMLEILVDAGASGLTEDMWRDLARKADAIGGANPYRAIREAREALVKNGRVRQEADRFIAN